LSKSFYWCETFVAVNVASFISDSLKVLRSFLQFEPQQSNIFWEAVKRRFDCSKLSDLHVKNVLNFHSLFAFSRSQFLSDRPWHCVLFSHELAWALCVCQLKIPVRKKSLALLVLELRLLGRSGPSVVVAATEISRHLTTAPCGFENITSITCRHQVIA